MTLLRNPTWTLFIQYLRRYFVNLTDSTRYDVIINNYCVHVTMVENFKSFSGHLIPAYFKIFSNHGGYLSAFLAIWDQDISKFSPNMVDNFKCFSSHLQPAYFKISSYHDRHFKCFSNHLPAAYFKFSPILEDNLIAFLAIWD